MVLESLLSPIPVISDQITPAQSHTSFPIKKTHFLEALYICNLKEIHQKSSPRVMCTVISLEITVRQTSLNYSLMNLLVLKSVKI